MSERILEIRGLNKYFGPTHANKNIDFDLDRGEIRGIIGENGSGKSTLLSQIAGLYGSDSGTMKLNGQPYLPKSPLEANRNGIAMVLQELGVVGGLPASVNVYLGHTGRFAKGGVVSLKAMAQAAYAECDKWDLPRVDMSERLEGTGIETRKMVELVRALSVDPQILILDEVTQSLSLNNRNRLYELIKRFKEMNRSILLITHDVEEMLEITDTVTVLRDGEVIGTVKSSEVKPEDIRTMMVGRDMSGSYFRDDSTPTYRDEVILKMDNVTSEFGEISDISFEVHAGEILGFCGLSDSGIHTVGEVAYGLTKIRSGKVTLEQQGVEITSATTALNSRAGYVPKDRDNQALMINASIRDNFALPSAKELQGTAGIISGGRINSLSWKMKDKMSVKARNIFQPMNALSGGNKQKVNLGRWLAKDLQLLILDCPTRGVDVGVKAYIYQLMKDAKEQGIAMILISDELTEVLGMADRLIVMKDGKMKKVIRRDEEFTEHSVIGEMI